MFINKNKTCCRNKQNPDSCRGFSKNKKGLNHEGTKTQRVNFIINIPVFVIRSFQSMSLSQERGWGEAIHMVPIFPPSYGSPAILI